MRRSVVLTGSSAARVRTSAEAPLFVPDSDIAFGVHPRLTPKRLDEAEPNPPCRIGSSLRGENVLALDRRCPDGTDSIVTLSHQLLTRFPLPRHSEAVTGFSPWGSSPVIVDSRTTYAST